MGKKKPYTPKIVPTIESYGVYVHADNGYVKVGAYDHIDRFVDFKFLHEIPYVERADNRLELTVFEKDFSERAYDFELRPVQIVVQMEPVHFDVIPLGDDKYRLTMDEAVKDGTMLHVNSGSFFNGGMGVIMLGHTQKALEAYFSQTEIEAGDASPTLYYLQDALQAFPDNEQLKAVLPFWENESAREKDAKDYGYVDAKWQQYNDTPSISLKLRYLNELIAEVGAYLNLHPQGGSAEQATERREYAQSKIPEYEKMR